MKLHIAAAVIVLGATPAAAQLTDRAESSKSIFQSCMTLATATAGECACVAGYYAGVAQPDELEMTATILKYMDAQGGIADQAGLVAGFAATKQKLQLDDTAYKDLLTRLDGYSDMGPSIDEVCVPVGKLAKAAVSSAQ